MRWGISSVKENIVLLSLSPFINKGEAGRSWIAKKRSKEEKYKWIFLGYLDEVEGGAQKGYSVTGNIVSLFRRFPQGLKAYN